MITVKTKIPYFYLFKLQKLEPI